MQTKPHGASIKSSSSTTVKMWFVRLFILCCYGCLSAAYVRPNFTSNNFKNVLHWEHLETHIPGQEVLYSVEYTSHSKDEPFEIKLECQNITALSCDLTAETPAIYDVHYLAQVYANGRFHGNTYRFKPMAETVLGPPILSTEIKDLSLYVNVTLPLGPSGASIADILNTYNPLSFNPSTVYTLHVTKPLWAIQDNISTTGQFVINLQTREEHCGYVDYVPNFEHGRPPSDPVSFCAIPPGDPWMLLPWFVVATAVLMVPAIILIIMLFLYLKKKRPLPIVLVNPCKALSPALEGPDDSLFISKAEVSPKHGVSVYNIVHDKPSFISTETEGYFSQDIPFENVSCDSTARSDRSQTSLPQWGEDTSGQSSVIYSAVGVDEPAKETTRLKHGAREERPDERLQLPCLLKNLSMDHCRNNAKLKTQPLSPDSQQPILLHTIVDSNGKLMLPMFTFDSETHSCPSTPEGPLLCDLLDIEDEGPLTLCSLHSAEDTEEWLDSSSEHSPLNTPTLWGNSCDSPIQPLLPGLFPDCQGRQSGPVPFASGYKRTWMPATPLGITSEVNRCQVITCIQQTWDHPDGENIEHIPRQITLGGCMLKILE